MHLDFVFKSPDHLRYQNGLHVSGPHGGARRAIKIEPNIEGCEGYDVLPGDGYIVTMFNLDGEHPIWQNNIQMSPKPMRIIKQESNKIELRGFLHKAKSPFGWIDYNGTDYGLTINFRDDEIENCILHMHDKNVDIEYLNDEIEEDNPEPEIILWANEVNSQFENETFTNARELLIKIYRSVKSNPGQLKDVTNYKSLGIAFFLMVEIKLTDDIDALQMMASLSYLCLSKAIEREPRNLNLYKNRLLILKIGHTPLRYTVMSGLRLNEGGIFAMTSGGSDIKARDAIYRMEIADLERNPQLYIQVPFFKERKNELDDMIKRKFFSSENNLDEIIQVGIENHEKLFLYLNNRVIENEDVDF